MIKIDKTTRIKYKQKLVDLINEKSDCELDATEFGINELPTIEQMAKELHIHVDEVFTNLVSDEEHGCHVCGVQGKSLNTYDMDLPNGLAKCQNPRCPILHYNPTGEYNGE